MIKALFFDLDGTLLNTSKEISRITKNTLERCRNSGIQLYIATARPPLLDKMLAWDDNTLSLFDGGSYYNGGCTLLENKKTYISLPDDVVRETIKCVNKYPDINIALQLQDEKHAFRIPLDEKGYRTWGLTANEARMLNQAECLKTIKILLFHSNLVDSTTPIDERLIITLEKLLQGTAQYYITDNDKCFQIMEKSVNKRNSIEKMRMSLGLGKNEVAVFGDDANDLEMLSEYEYSIAMGNADECVKSKAKYVTLDNDNDGVHHAICNILCLLK